jgi:transposase
MISNMSMSPHPPGYLVRQVEIFPLGRPSIAPEKLLRALLLQVLYSVRSERLLMEQLDYNLLFRWFIGLNMDDAVWDPTVFTKSRAAPGREHRASVL